MSQLSFLGVLTPKAAWGGRKVEVLWEAESLDQWWQIEVRRVWRASQTALCLPNPKEPGISWLWWQSSLSAPTASHLFKDKAHLCKPAGHQEGLGHSDCRGLWAFTECRHTLKQKCRLQRAGDSFKVDRVNSIQLRKVKFPDGSQNVWKWIWTFVSKIFGLVGETHFSCFLKLIFKGKQNPQDTVQCPSEIFGMKYLINEQLYSATTCTSRWPYTVALLWKVTL